MPILENSEFTKNIETFKKEVSLSVNNFNKEIFWEDREAISMIIKNIILTKPGTYPNNPDFGVGIEDYIFDFSTDNNLADIQFAINSQFEKWIKLPENIYLSSKLKFSKTNTNGPFNNLVIFFTVTTNENFQYDDDNFTDYTLTMYITGDTKNRKIITEMTI